jgi:FkbM family methyltransferase
VSGAKAYIDPFSTSGRIIIDEGSYEPELVELMRRKLAPGGVFVDIGANEGLFSAVAASIVGEKGLVVAVEPQSRLRDVLEINIALNSRGRYRIHRNVIGEKDGLELSLSLGPSSHTGGSSLVRAYRWSRRTEKVASRTVDSILAEEGNPTVDLMKIDVEGYEPEVVNSAEGTLAARRVKAIAVDYHGSILATRGIDPRAVDQKIRAHGYRLESGSPEGGYCVYSI